MNTLFVRSVSCSFALVITFTLFGVMMGLIHRPLTIDTPPTFKLPSVQMPELKKPPVEDLNEVEDVPLPEKEPITELNWQHDGPIATTTIYTGPIDKPVVNGPTAYAPPDGAAMPLVKVAAVYPARAARNGIEGYCTVEYVVTATGATRDVHVVEDQCTNSVFWNNSVKAAQKFKYQPQVINGNAVETFGKRNRFTFNLE